ncbi:MAG TPA: type II toxin-antitoxin system Phd/YefM family antitoxin [Bdellovibrionota bacterium]|nr:type II toxin-antitoxin system Phd/YefM family antitoxin [Bdellovibrionota bacterium]
MPQLVTVTKAKQRLLELARRNQELGESFILLKNGNPVSALLPFEEYEALLETLDILETEPDILAKLRAAEREVAAGRYTVWKGRPQRRKKQ